jgi:hypothetical protein
MKVPAFLLRRLYVKGSLRNVNGGFEFDLKNTLGSGYAESVMPITLDEEALPTSATKFIVDGVAIPFEDVSADNPMTLGMNKLVTVAIDGHKLAAGKHKVGVGFMVTGMGELAFDVTDAVDAG